MLGVGPATRPEIEPMAVNVELFGIPRARAGVAATTAEGDCLGDALADLAARFPELAATCIDGRALRPGYTANLDGERFITDPATRLVDGDRLMLLSLDAGG
jgi:molybdopterin converting factor small subunit